jgi:ribonuclease Z
LEEVAVSARELVVLGTASQVPTRTRAHHAAFLRWDHHGILLDPGEGTQRQMTLAGVTASSITRICITHAHGDHCLGLAGVLQRMSLDDVPGPIDVHAPVPALPYVERLRHATAYHQDVTDVRIHGERAGIVADRDGLRIRAVELSHRIPTLGYRFEEPDSRTLLPDRLEAAGVRGADRARLQRVGRIEVEGRTIHLDDVSRPRRGQSAALVMDTRWCDGALELADGVDLLVVEATFLESERELAEAYGHLTAAQAARLAVEADVGRVVLTHISQRYPTNDGHLAEAQRAAPELQLTVASDLDRIALPKRRAALSEPRR